METFFGIMIPFLGTTLGSACVFFMKKSLGDLVRRALAGFAAGVMVAASIWSLLIPAIEQSEGMGKLSFLPAFIGFWVGVLFLLLLDRLIPHLHVGSEQAEGPKSKLGRTTMMVLAVTGPVDKCQKTAETRSGPGRIGNMQIEKDGACHPFKV